MKGKNNYIKFSNTLFVIYVVSLIGCGLFFYNRVKVMDRTFDMVAHTMLIKQKIRQVEAEVSISESAQRGFLLTKDPVFLTHFEMANNNAMRAIDTIVVLTTDNPEQMSNAMELKALTAMRLTLLKEILQEEDFFASDSGVRKERLLNGKKIMDSLLNLSDTMNRIENELLTNRSKARNQARDITPKYVFGILLFSVMVISLVYFALTKRYR